jgi:hypothetical protein
MIIRSFAAIAILSLAVANPAAAQNNNAASSTLTVSQIDQRLTAAGYRVMEVERDDGEFEVKAYNAQGQCRELHLNLRTGDILREEGDDDCHDSGRGRRGGDRR